MSVGDKSFAASVKCLAKSAEAEDSPSEIVDRSFSEPAIFSSKKSNWGTPWKFFSKIDEEFSFSVDAAAEISNTKCESFISKEIDAFSTDWDDWAVEDDIPASRFPLNIFLNPPYGRGKTVETWIRRAWEQSKRPGIKNVVCLVASRTDTIWFHELAWKYAAEIRFIRGRLVFEDDGKPAKNSGTFPSVLIVFDGKPNGGRKNGPKVSTMDSKER